MNKIERSKVIKEILDELYPSVPIPLNHTDPFTLLVAVLLSAQCTDERVNLVTPALFKIGPTPKEMAKKSISEIHHCIRTCGLANTKAKNVKKLAELLVSRHNSIVPNDFSALEALPGVGHKTASVVVSQAFGTPAFPVDTHIHRLMYRWGFSNGKSVKRTEQDAKRLFPKILWNKLHIQIILYGRSFSPARG